MNINFKLLYLLLILVNKKIFVQSNTIPPKSEDSSNSDLPTKFGGSSSDDSTKIMKKTPNLKKTETRVNTNSGAKKKDKIEIGLQELPINVGDKIIDDDYDDESDEETMDPDEGTSDYKFNSYDEKGEFDPLFENFGEYEKSKGLPNDLSPIFLIDPQNTYIIKGQPATLTCKAAHALSVIIFYFFI